VADGKFRKKDCDAGLIAALLAGGTIEGAARTAGCSESTARRRMEDPTFSATLKRERAALLQRIVDRLASVGRLSVDTLFELLKSKNERIRLGAAKNALAALFRGREVLQLSDELEDLRAIVEKLAGDRQS
jgi:hypothetical protein